MTSTILQPTMAWSNEKIRLSCVDNIGLRQLWKLIALDCSNKSNNNNSNNNNGSSQTSKSSANTITMSGVATAKNTITNNNNNNNKNKSNTNCNNNLINEKKSNIENCENLTEFYANRDILPPNRMSLLKFLAINALELSAPASPVLLQQKHSTVAVENDKPTGWMQLSGHPESIVPTTSGIVRKRVASPTDSEVCAYKIISIDETTSKIAPKFFGTLENENGDVFIELQDLLAGFKDPNVMDIKMGCRTFLESEVKNTKLRPDLYQKMINVDKDAPTIEEHEQRAITKLRYMLFREAMSSSQTKCFRIEALRLRGGNPVNNLKTIRTAEQIEETILQFLNGNKTINKELIKRLRSMRTTIEQSEFFQRHEIVGSSVFIVYDDDKVGAWLIDFAKSRELPPDCVVNHRDEWIPGNREEGLLRGMDELIIVFENVYEIQCNRKCGNSKLKFNTEK